MKKDIEIILNLAEKLRNEAILNENILSVYIETQLYPLEVSIHVFDGLADKIAEEFGLPVEVTGRNDEDFPFQKNVRIENVRFFELCEVDEDEK